MKAIVGYLISVLPTSDGIVSPNAQCQADFMLTMPLKRQNMEVIISCQDSMTAHLYRHKMHQISAGFYFVKDK